MASLSSMQPEPAPVSPQQWETRKHRAKNAKETINVLIPKIVKAIPRAQAGISRTALIAYTPSLEPGRPSTDPSSPSAAQPRIRVVKSDTFDAAIAILDGLPSKSNKKVAVLNMASALQPGGGVLSGSMAQEESLCVRSTLYASISTQSYRLPELSAVYSPDVLIFRPSGAFESKILPKEQFKYVDVISCAAIKQPETEIDSEGKRRYAEERDQETMVAKVRLVLQVARLKGITHLVMGAFGCGAYGNPTGVVAEIFRKVLVGDRRRMSAAGGVIEDIVFAIINDGENLRVFAEVLQGLEGDG